MPCNGAVWQEQACICRCFSAHRPWYNLHVELLLLHRWGRQGGEANKKPVQGAANLWRAASIQGFESIEDGEDPECGICLDEPHEVNS